jgi:hypothetical protein
MSLLINMDRAIFNFYFISYFISLYISCKYFSVLISAEQNHIDQYKISRKNIYT